MQQAITISKDASTAPPVYNVDSGALLLKFNLLFLRDPGPGEGDWIISIPELQTYAEHCWAYVRD